MMNKLKIWKKMNRVLMIVLCITLWKSVVYAAPIASADSAVINIESYEVVEGILKPGEHVTISMLIKNHSKVTEAKNVVVTFHSTENALLPIYGEDNQICIDSILPDETKEITIKVVVNSDYKADAAQIQCNFSYASGITILENSTKIFIPTYTTGKLIAESTMVAANASVGAKCLVSVRYKNVSTVDITNAKLVMEGNVEEENKEIILPTMLAGKSYVEDYYVTFIEDGIQRIAIYYSYEDNEGNTYHVDCGEYQVNVLEKDAGEGNIVSVEMVSESDKQIKGIALLALAGVAAMIAAVVYIKKR